MSEPLEKANWKEWILYRLGQRRAFLVEGDSMTPTLVDGEVVLIESPILYNVGDIVIANHPYKSSVKILKRIAEIEADDALQLIGDNPAESTDSRAFGAVSIESILGKVVCKLK